MEDTECAKNVEERKEAVEEREEASTDNNEDKIHKHECGAYQFDMSNKGVAKCSKSCTKL